MLKSEIRKDYIQEKYVIIAPRRADRPHHPEPKHCPFCPGTAPDSGESGVYYAYDDGTAGPYDPGKGAWSIKVLPNIYPAVSLDNPRAYGQQEVVVETARHNHHLEEFTMEHMSRLLSVYGARTTEITKNEKIEYVIIFKNQGGSAGASLDHAHSQIFATDFIPPQLLDKSQRTQRYKLEHGSCVYCDVIKQEQNGPRLVYRDSYVIAFCPYASMYNYEVWIMPIRHLDNVTLLTPEERQSWASVMKLVLPKVAALGLDYNYYFHQVVHDEDQHLYMKVTPRGSLWAGVEIGSGIIINPITPEEAAKYYQKE